MKIRSGIKSTLLLVCCCCALSAYAADTINGVVRNHTTGKAAAGDEVILLRLQNGMEEESRTRTDAKGAFSLRLTSADSPHVVRVLHQRVNYDQTMSGKSPLEIAVFNAGPRNFEISIAPKATLDSLEVKKGGGIWVTLAPLPIKGQQERYAVDFPIRPGDTLFKFVYHLPYTGPTNLHVKLAYPVKSFAVMHPPSMSFKPSSAQAFTSPGLAQGLRVEQAVSKPVVRDVPEFEVSGIGLAAPAQAAGTSSATSPAAAVASPKPDTP